MAQSVITPALDSRPDSRPVEVTTKSQLGTTVQESHDPSSVAPIPNFARVVDDAMVLLTHAAETGVDVDAATRSTILTARAAATADWNYADAGNLLAALSLLTGKLKPVTADSLRASSSNLINPDIQSLRRWTLILAGPIVLFSVLSFVSTSIASAIHSDITTANELLVKLRGELGTPTSPSAGTPDKPTLPQGLNEGDVLTQLQTYASTVRAIDARARQLNWFVLKAEHDPYASYRWNSKLNPQQRQANQETIKDLFQLPIGLPNMPLALDKLTGTYQDVRSFTAVLVGV